MSFQSFRWRETQSVTSVTFTTSSNSNFITNAEVREVYCSPRKWQWQRNIILFHKGCSCSTSQVTGIKQITHLRNWGQKVKRIPWRWGKVRRGKFCKFTLHQILLVRWNTVELHVSGVTGTASHPDMQKIPDNWIFRWI